MTLRTEWRTGQNDGHIAFEWMSSCWQAVEQRVRAFLAGIADRREFWRLQDMDDGQLRDIGLSRADLSVARERANPTAVLAGIIDERCPVRR